MINKRNNKTYFKNYSIQKAITFSFTLISIIGLIIVGVTFYARYTLNLNKITLEKNDALLNQVVINVNSYLNNMVDISKGIYYEIINGEDIDIQKELDIIYKINDERVLSVGIFSKYGDVLYSSGNINLKKNVDARNTSWFKDAIKNKNTFNFSTPHIQQYFNYQNSEYPWVISISKYVKIQRHNEIIDGVFLLDFKFSEIEKIMFKANLGEKGYVYLTNKNGDIVYHPRQQLIYYNLLEENNKKNSEFEIGIHNEKYKGIERIVNVKLIDTTKWKLIGITPSLDMKKGYINIALFIFAIMLLTILLILIFNMILAKRITLPIKDLENAVKNFEDGNLDFKIEIDDSFSEIKYLGDIINSMLDSIKNLIISVKLENAEKRKSELNALQAQINPHFLYNTLDSIVSMIENEKYKESIDMTISLARLFRISLSKGKNIIPIKDELEHIKNYLKIQSIRYKNKFSYKINCSEELLQCQTIKLTIQPIVENAIYHGVSFLEDDGEIYINVYEKDGNINIDVIDNGLGMSKDLCENMLSGNIEPKGGGSGIGIKNVNDRIKLYFGEDYGIKIYSEYDEGTTIKIIIPIKLDEKEGD